MIGVLARSRRLGLGFLIVVLTGGLVAASAGATQPDVSGTMTGPGGFVPGGCSGTILIRGTGTFTATVLGSGTYRYDVCVTVAGIATFDGTATLTTTRGTLSGTIASQFTGGSPQFPLTITAGTGKYRKTRGALLLGPLAETDLHNCDPRVGICFDWTDTGPLVGTLTHVPHA